MDTQIIILAAGNSSRMGQHKLLLPIAGQTLLQRTVRTALKISSKVLVVLGRDADLLKATLDGLPVQFVINPDFNNGRMETSFQTAIDFLREPEYSPPREPEFSPPREPEYSPPQATLLMLADMPLITSQMLLQMQTVFLEQQPLIVASRFGTIIAPPHLFAHQLLPLLGQTGAKPLIMQHFEQTIFMDWEEEKLFDVDTAEDLVKLEQHIIPQ